VSADAVQEAVRVLRSGEPTLLIVTGPALHERGLELAARICAKTGAKLMGQTFNRRMQRGAGRISVDRIPYPVDQALGVLAGLKHIILVGSRIPVAFFAYPDKPSLLAPDGTQFHTLARTEEDMVHALEWLADELGARAQPIAPSKFEPPAKATGEITAATLAQSIGALIPENAIVVDEGVSTGRGFFPSTRQSQPHDWLQNMGGSIGLGLPMATGAAVACPDRQVLSLQADGSAMYTIQALWTQAREGLNITTVLFNNRSYAILRHELANVGAQNVGRKALDMLDLGRPDMDFVMLARSLGVPGSRVNTMEEFNREVARGLATPGPYLVEVMLA
jgi:acetolactate synthase-1/2/3 large subunit